MDKIPLNYEASEGDTHKQLTSELPVDVVQCLENARFVRRPNPPPRAVAAAIPRRETGHFICEAITVLTD